MNESSETVIWEDIVNAAAKMFKVWLAGGELEWAEECWGHFQTHGLADNGNALERTSTLLRLVTLARVYEEYSGYAWDENPATPVDYLVENLEIDLVALGILAATMTEVNFDEFCEESELHEVALIAVTDALRADIFKCLCSAYGDSTALYSRISRTKPALDGDKDKFEITGPNSRALEFVMGGFMPM